MIDLGVLADQTPPNRRISGGEERYLPSAEGTDQLSDFRESGTLSVLERVIARLLQVAGGASGGVGSNNRRGGGGGAGEFEEVVVILEPGDYPVVVGEGGISREGSGVGLPGQPTSVGTRSVDGGGGGAGGGSNQQGADGGSGGGGIGAHSPVVDTPGGDSTAQAPGQGNRGGDGLGSTAANTSAGGGGGAGGPGDDGTAGQAPDGGPGVVSDITGEAEPYAAGGGGSRGNTSAQTGGLGGDGIGGDGAPGNVPQGKAPGADAVDGTGSGGGGTHGGTGRLSGKGGKGRAILRVRSHDELFDCTGVWSSRVFDVGSNSFPDLTGHEHHATNSGALWLPDRGLVHAALPGVSGNHLLLQHGGALGAQPTVLRWRMRIACATRPAAETDIAGGDSTFQRVRMLSDGRLRIGVRQADTNFIGSAVSTAALPSSIPGWFWLDIALNRLTAECSYAYSLDDTDDPNAVSWTALGGGIGANAGGAMDLGSTSQVLVGASSTGIAGHRMAVRRALYEVDGVRRGDCDLRDFPAAANPQPTSWVSAFGETWQIGRTTTTGLKAVVVTESTILAGAGAKLVVPHHFDLNVAPNESATWLSVVRFWHAGQQAIFYKRDGSNDGWLAFMASNGLAVGGADPGAIVTDNGPVIPLGGKAVVAVVRNVVAGTLETFVNGVSNGAATALPAGTDFTSTYPVTMFDNASGQVPASAEGFTFALVKQPLLPSAQLALADQVGRIVEVMAP